MSNAFVKKIENFLHELVNSAEAEIVTYATPAIQYIEANGGKAVLSLAEAVLAGAVAGTPWATLSASLVTSAEAAGIQLAEGAASAVLNFAKANMVAQGQPTA